MDSIANDCIIDNVVFLALKTTGMDQYRNEIIEISAIKVKENNFKSYYSLVKPKNRVPGYIYESCPDITEEKLNKAPYIDELENEFLKFIEDLPVICYNGNLESGFILEYIKGFRNDILDLMEFAAILEPWQKEFKLETLINQVTNSDINDIYSVKNYCNYMIVLLNSLLCRQWDREERNKQRKKSSLYQILTTQYNLIRRWKWTKYLERPLMFSTIKYTYVNFDDTDKYSLNLKKIKIDYNKYEDLLKDKSIWNNGGDFNYEFRKDQWLFTKKIRENIERDEKIFIEAPTGSGKTFAYVLTAALKAYINKQKNKVADASFIISTDTKELQNQLIYKDIPSILSKLGLEDKINYGSIKGKSNYICVDRLIKTQIFSGDLSSILAEIFLKRLCASGEYGDVENINFWAYKHFALDEYISDVLCDNDECNIEKCHRTCYLKKRYNDLPLENITVINHSLLASWPYSEKKKITHLIIDEAHNLMDKCYDFFSEEFNSEEFQELLQNISENEPTIFRQLASLNASFGYKENIDLDKMKYWVKEIKTSIAILLNKTVELKLAGGEYNFKSEFYLPSLEYKRQLNSLTIFISQVKEGIYGIYSLLNRYLNNIAEDEKDITDDKDYVNVYNYVLKLKSAFDVIDKFLEVPEKKDNFAKVIEIAKDYSYFKITNIPLNVGDLVNEKILKDVKSTTFLSATMRINNSFARIKDTLGQENTKEHVVNPTFNLKKQTQIFLLDDLGRYNSENFAKKSAEFIFKMANKISGHMLVLFTNNNRKKRVETELFELAHGTTMEIHTNKKSIAYLKDRNKKIVILGSKGFFEGIDVPGDALTCVMIDKIPNKSLEDPLLKAITFYENKKYVDVNYPQVCIKMKQVYGRLIRSILDYGYFCILDCGENKGMLNRLEKDLRGPTFKKCSGAEILKACDKDYRKWSLNNLYTIHKDVEKNLNYIDNFNREAERKKSFWTCDEGKNGILYYKNLGITMSKKK